LSSRVVNEGASVLVKENKLFSFSLSPMLLYGDRCGYKKNLKNTQSALKVKPRHILTHFSNGIHYRLAPLRFANQENYRQRLVCADKATP